MVDGTGAFAVGQGDLYSIAGMQIFGAFDHALGTRNHRIASRQNLLALLLQVHRLCLHR